MAVPKKGTTPNLKHALQSWPQQQTAYISLRAYHQEAWLDHAFVLEWAASMLRTGPAAERNSFGLFVLHVTRVRWMLQESSTVDDENPMVVSVLCGIGIPGSSMGLHVIMITVLGHRED